MADGFTLISDVDGRFIIMDEDGNILTISDAVETKFVMVSESVQGAAGAAGPAGSAGAAGAAGAAGVGVPVAGTTGQVLAKLSNSNYDTGWTAPGGGVTDHGALSGLADDDHGQYHNNSRGDARYSLLAHSHTLANVTDVTMTVANLNALDDAANTALHFHDADRARANHTGTQLSGTISDFTEAAQDATGAMLDATLVYADATPALGRAAITGHITIAAASNVSALGSFTMAQLDAAVNDGNVSYTGHSHTLANITDVTMTVANLNALDDAANTALHFHDADRARANHTGTQLASTVSDFAEAVDDRVAALLVAGTNVTLSYNDAGNALTINATAGSGTFTINAVTVNFAGPSKGQFFDVAFAGATVGQKVLAAPSLDMPAGVAEDEFEMDPVFAFGHVKTAGQVRLFVGSVNGGILGGDRKINVTLS
jgi:hypothetical protein